MEPESAEVASSMSAQEGWSENTPTSGNKTNARTGGEALASDPLALAAKAAKLSEKGALGFVGVEGMSQVIHAVQRSFETVLSTKQDKDLTSVDPTALVEELKKNDVVQSLLNEPARMREANDQCDTLEVVLEDISSFKSTREGEHGIEMEDVYRLFGLGGPDLDDPNPSTSTFVTVEDSEVMEQVLQELSEDQLGYGQILYFGGLGKSHLGRQLRGEWEELSTSADHKDQVRAKLESKIGSECIRNDLYMLHVNTLQGSRPTMNGASLSSVNHVVAVQNVSVPLYGAGEEEEGEGRGEKRTKGGPRGQHTDVSSGDDIDLSHLKQMVPTKFSQEGSNLSSAQALAALNSCLVMDKDADETSQHIDKSVIAPVLQKFLPDTERERMLQESSSSSSDNENANQKNNNHVIDARILRSELIKSSELLQLLQDRTSAKLDYQSLNDLREIKITITEIVFHEDVPFSKVWFETNLLDSEDDFMSVSSSIKISGVRGAHKTELLNISYNLCESSGSIYKSCQKIVEGEAQDVLVLRICAKDSSSGGESHVVVGSCNLKMTGGTEQVLQPLNIMSPEGKTVGKLRVRLEANAAFDCVRKFNENAVPSFKLFIYGGLQRKQKSKHLIPSNRLQIYDAATNDLSASLCSGATPSPASCQASAMLGDIMIVQGGLNKQKLEDKVHALDMNTSTWYELKNDNESAPGARFDHSASVLMDKEDFSVMNVVFFGGEKDEGMLSNSISILEISNTAAILSTPITSYQWQKATVSGTIPRPRAGHATATVSTGDKEVMYAFGGRILEDGAKQLSNEMICGSLTTTMDQNGQRKKNFHWELVEVEGPLPRAREKCSLHSIRTKLLMSHGWIGNGELPWTSDFWLFDIHSKMWKKVLLENPAHFPTSRYGIGSIMRYNRSTKSTVDLHVCNSDGTLTKCNGEEETLDLEVTAGNTKRFLLRSLDTNGEPCNKPGNAFIALVSRKTKDGSKYITCYPKVQQLPQDNSLFSFEFKSVVAGVHDVEIFSAACQDKPALSFNISVRPSEACPDCFVVSGPATISCIASEKALLSIALHDRYGNPLEDISEEQVKEIKAMVKFKRENTTKVKIEKSSNSEVSGSFVLQEKGTYNLYIFYQGKIAASMDIKCLAGGISLPKTYVEPTSIAKKSWHSGIEYKFSVVLCDKSGIKIRAQDVQGSEKMLKAFAEEYADDHKGGSHVNECTASVNKDGTVGFSFTPTRSGECVVNVHYFLGEYKPHAIEGCPFMLKVSSSELDPSKCKLVKEVASTMTAGEAQILLVQAKDKYGNNVSTSNEHVRCRVETLQSKRTAKKIDATNKGDGTYEIILDLEDVGSYRVHFEMMKAGQPKPIHGSPREVKVVAAHLSPSNCTAFGQGIQGMSPAGQPTSFVVVMRDPFGNRIHTSGSRVEAIVQSAVDIPSSVTDNGDGTYTCSYVAGMEDEFHGRTVYQVTVKVNGVELEESPYFQRVYPPQTSAYNTIQTGLPQRMNAGESIEFVVQARDLEGRDSVHGMDPFVLEIEVEEKKQGKDKQACLKGEIKDLHNGKYLVKLFASENVYANASVGILLGTLSDPVQEHIRDSPFELMITPKGLFGMGLWGAKLSSAASKVSIDESLANMFMLSGRGLSECVAGEETQFDLMPVQGNMVSGGAMSKPKANGSSRDRDGSNSASSSSHTQLEKHSFSVELRGPEYVQGVVEGPNKDGTFQARYRAFQSGSYVLLVKVGRFVLQQCPFTVQCTPDVTCPDTCEVDTFGLQGKRAGEDLKLKVITLDAQRNKNYSDDESFKVICRGGSIQGKGRMAKFTKHVVEADSRPLGEGIHECTFQVPIEGAYSLQVLHVDRKTDEWSELEASPVQFVADKAEKTGKENPDGEKKSAAVAMTSLTQKALALAQATGSGEPRKPNFLERRLKKVLGEKDIATDDLILQDAPQPIFSAGLWREKDYWEKQGIYTIGLPTRLVQWQHKAKIKRGNKQAAQAEVAQAE